ncbi:MAG: hypothetical protein RIR87_779 [Actinomycetota bacterium]
MRAAHSFGGVDSRRFSSYASGAFHRVHGHGKCGVELGNQWDKVEPYVAVLQYVVIAVIVLFVVRFALKKLRNRT